jgi:hypothetical protein
MSNVSLIPMPYQYFDKTFLNRQNCHLHRSMFKPYTLITVKHYNILEAPVFLTPFLHRTIAVCSPH